MPDSHEAPRRGDWIQTYTGRQFWPLDPRPEEVVIEDIAHALSMQCRYAGHCLKFYSVAEHCVLMAEALYDPFGPDVALVALMHDAAEAYLVDLPRPIKRFMPAYNQAEDAVWRAIAQRFRLPDTLPAEVEWADRHILTDERQQNMAPSVPWSTDGLPLGVTLQNWPPEIARQVFLARFHELFRETV